MSHHNKTPKKRIYLVSPRNPENFWKMQGTLDVIGGNRSLMPNAGLLTLVALTPDDLDIEYIFRDENIGNINWNESCDLVAVTGYTLHAERITEICNKFRSRGVPVALGGAFATLNYERVKGLADYLFIGEAELTWPAFLNEWIEGKAAPVYKQDSYIDIKISPPPDLSLIQAKNYVYFPVQTSRGCPNNCDFCDVIRLVGRKYRIKPVENVMEEVKNAHACGAETVFFSDDNFFVKREYTLKLLKELIKWNTKQPIPLSFSTQVTVQVGSDDEILKLLADARFSVLFIGLETINKECLEEVNKGQMSRHNPFEVIPAISKYGILPFLGMIVGFDHDDTLVFSQYEKFLDATSTPIASITLLNAPENTALYDRMKAENRLIEEFNGYWHLSTNVVPKNMSLEELKAKHLALSMSLFKPENFEKRLLGWVNNVQYFTDLYSTRKKNFFRIFRIVNILKHFIFKVPPDVRDSFFRIIWQTWAINPKLISRVISVMSQYWHFYDFVHKAALKLERDRVSD